jgi:hypothetical protein
LSAIGGDVTSQNGSLDMRHHLGTRVDGWTLEGSSSNHSNMNGCEGFWGTLGVGARRRLRFGQGVKKEFLIKFVHRRLTLLIKWPHGLPCWNSPQQRTVDTRDPNSSSTKEVTATFGLPYILSEWTLIAIGGSPNFWNSAVTRNNMPYELYSENGRSASQIARMHMYHKQLSATKTEIVGKVPQPFA